MRSPVVPGRCVRVSGDGRQAVAPESSPPTAWCRLPPDASCTQHRSPRSDRSRRPSESATWLVGRRRCGGMREVSKMALLSASRHFHHLVAEKACRELPPPKCLSVRPQPGISSQLGAVVGRSGSCSPTGQLGVAVRRAHAMRSSRRPSNIRHLCAMAPDVNEGSSGGGSGGLPVPRC
jgi:hypothetical protein